MYCMYTNILEKNVVIVDITQVVHKGTNYLNKKRSVCQ